MIIPFDQLGFTTSLEQSWQEVRRPGRVLGRVSSQRGPVYEVMTATGKVDGMLSGRIRYESHDALDIPAVGDWVYMAPTDEGSLSIEGLLPRNSQLVRQVAGKRSEPQVVAANVDRVFVVSSMNSDFSAARIERYLAMVHEAGAEPIVVLTKGDLASDPDSFVRQAQECAGSTPVVCTRALEEDGASSLFQFLGTGVTVGLVGSSGVGKSTIVNAMIGSEIQETAEIREADSKGRHTTTRRQLLVLPNRQGLLIDTPGMRELGLVATEEGIASTFPEIVAAAAACRFRSCTHDHEPGCAVKQALAEGELETRRLENYQTLLKELATHEDRQTRAKKPVRGVRALRRSGKKGKGKR